MILLLHIYSDQYASISKKIWFSMTVFIDGRCPTVTCELWSLQTKCCHIRTPIIHYILLHQRIKITTQANLTTHSFVRRPYDYIILLIITTVMRNSYNFINDIFLPRSAYYKYAEIKSAHYRNRLFTKFVIIFDALSSWSNACCI